MDACSQASAPLQRPGAAAGAGSGSLLQAGQRRGAPARAHRGAAAETPRVGLRAAAHRHRGGRSFTGRPSQTTTPANFQVPAVDARLHGEQRGPEHQTGVSLQTGGRVDSAIDAGDHTAAGPRIWKYEGCKRGRHDHDLNYSLTLNMVPFPP